MSIVRVFYNPLNGSDKDEFHVEHGTQIIDFLEQEFPKGFEGYLRVFVGTDEIDINDLDYTIQEDEQITLLVMPVSGIEIGAIVINALIAVAIGFVINLLFPPKTPGAAKQESESPVYSLNANRNAARLGDPIEVTYGTVSWPASFASAPYSFHYDETNDQFVDEMLCLGMGFYDVDQIFIGDTPLTSLEPGTVQWWLFNPDEHRQTFGVITDTLSARLANTGMPLPFRENVFTSPEVTDVGEPFNNDKRLDTGGAGIAGVAIAAGYDAIAKQDLEGRIAEVSSSIDIRAGDTITITGTTSNNGAFMIGGVTVDPNNGALMTIFEDPASPTKFVDEDPLAGTFTVTTPTENLTAGPYRAQKEGREITEVQCDIIFKEGLYRIDGTSGNMKPGGLPDGDGSRGIDVEFICQRIDENGDPIDAPIVVPKLYEGRQRTPLRSTVFIPVPQGAYEVSVRRVTAVNDDTRQHEKFWWTGLKGVVVLDKQEQAYGPVTLLCLRMKASKGLGEAARSRVRVTATRNLGTGINSANPITAIKDVWVNADYGMGKSIDELDLDTLDPLEVYWGSLEGGPRFNATFDSRDTGFAAMNSIASLAGGKIVQVGGLTSIATDVQQPVRKAMFTSANMVKDSLNIEYAFQVDEYDGVQIEYRDPVTFQPAFVTQLADSLFPDTFTLFGCTDLTYATEYAVYMRGIKRHRRKRITFSTELDGMIPRIGDRFGVSTPMPDWGLSGTVTDVIDARTLRVDQMLTWSDTEKNIMILRDQYGVPGNPLEVTRGSADNIVVFSTDVVANDAVGQEPTMYAFGIQFTIIRDFILEKIAPKGEKIVEIQGQVYAPVIYNGAPPHMSGGDNYSCSSQVDAATAEGIEYSLTLTSDDANWPYPFATSGSNVTFGDPTKFAVFRDYVSGPSLQPDWNSSLPEKQDVTGFADYDSLSLYEQCQITNKMTQMVGMQTTTSSPVAIIPPSNITTGTTYPSSTSVFTVTGYEGSGINSGSTLLSGQLGHIKTFNTGINDLYSEVNMSVQITGDVNGDAVVSVSVGEDAGVDSFTIDAGNYVQKWVNVVVTETTTMQVISSSPLLYRIVVTVKVTVTQEDGTTETKTAVGYDEQNYPTATLNSWEYVPINTISNGFYYLPVMFYGGVNRKVSIGYLAYGPGEGDHTVLSQAFLNNFNR